MGNPYYMAVPSSLYSSTSTTSGTPATFLPYAIKKRGDVTFSKDHRITTMTVGVGLGGQYTDTTNYPKSQAHPLLRGGGGGSLGHLDLGSQLCDSLQVG